jgi:uncharacterized membrane protein YeaQ/YmgE (transglycosylase-associated protein family)
MLHLISYLIVGFIAGCVWKALMHTHLTIVLGIVSSIIGGAVTHLLPSPSGGGRFHSVGLIVSILGAIVVLYGWHRFRLRCLNGRISLLAQDRSGIRQIDLGMFDPRLESG